MANQRQPLSRSIHAGLRYNAPRNHLHTAHIMAIPVIAAEAEHIAREYVLVFDREQPKAIALLGSKQNTNSYLNDQGKWLARYIPALIRAYPFSLEVVNTNEVAGEEQYSILFDPAAPHLQSDHHDIGEQILDDSGEPTEFLAKVQKTLIDIHLNTALTDRHITQFDQLGLLVEDSIAIKAQNITLNGFRIIDRQQLAALSPEALTDLHRSGALSFLHAHLISLHNAEDSPLILSPRLESTTAPAPQAEAGIIEEDFKLDFSNFQPGEQ